MFNSEDLINKVPEKGDAIAYIRYSCSRNRMRIDIGRVTEVFESAYRIGDQVRVKEHILFVITNDCYTKIAARQIRNARKNIDHLII